MVRFFDLSSEDVRRMHHGLGILHSMTPDGSLNRSLPGGRHSPHAVQVKTALNYILSLPNLDLLMTILCFPFRSFATPLINLMTTSPSKDSPANRSGSSQRVFSLFTAPFSSRSRSFADFDIHLDEPLREYKAGDVIKGSIQLAVPKPLRITHLALSLHGFAKVYKNAAAPGNGLPSEVRTPTPGRGKTGVEYLGNGLVSLFEDEIILCGGGKLNLGKYSFRFEAQFPTRSLPSSLSFERGTICYVLVATLTRPTTIIPTMSKEKAIPFRETLDIAFEPRPKPRELHIKAKRSKQRDTKRDSTSNANHSSTDDSEQLPDDKTQDSNASETSHDTGLDSFVLQTLQTPSRATLSIETPTSPTTSPSEMIIATVDVLKGGFLPNDYIPVRISIKHTRPIKSMQGVIVTLYRKAKIDAYPRISDSKNPPSKDPISKPRTGFKSLKLTGRGSHLYRMDLAQAFAPLIVNPLTLEANIKVAVKIPDDVFPTVKSVPGQMIVFTYHVEVIMDLGGRLSNQDRLFSGMNMTKKAPTYSVGAKISESEYGLPLSMEMYHLIDTSEIKREKGVAQETIEVLIGSHDSKRKANDTKKNDLWLQDDVALNSPDEDEFPTERQSQETPRSPTYIPVLTSNATNHISTMYRPSESTSSGFQQPTDEKSRLRLAEQRLLPSAPPESEDLASNARTVPSTVPSAPLISDLEPYHLTNNVASAPIFESLGLHTEGETAPAYRRETNRSVDTITVAPPIPSESTAERASEDKAELERQRLLAMASSPDEDDGDDLNTVSNIVVPSAPELSDLTTEAIVGHEPTLPVYAPRDQT